MAKKKKRTHKAERAVKRVFHRAKGVVKKVRRKGVSYMKKSRKKTRHSSGNPAGASSPGKILTIVGLAVAGAVGGSLVASKIPVKDKRIQATIPLAAGIGLAFTKVARKPEMLGVILGLIAAGGLGLVRQVAPQIPLLAGEEDLLFERTPQLTYRGEEFEGENWMTGEEVEGEEVEGEEFEGENWMTGEEVEGEEVEGEEVRLAREITLSGWQLP